MRAITRKCSICKEPIYINEQTTRKRKPKTIEECQLYIDECRQADREVEKKTNIKTELYEFLFDMYDISYFPKYFYIKILWEI